MAPAGVMAWRRPGTWGAYRLADSPERCGESSK